MLNIDKAELVIILKGWIPSIQFRGSNWIESIQQIKCLKLEIA